MCREDRRNVVKNVRRTVVSTIELKNLEKGVTVLYIDVIYFLSFFVCMVGTYLCQGSTPHPAFTSSLSSFDVVVTVAVSAVPIKGKSVRS